MKKRRKTLSKLEREKASKKRAAEFEEVLDETGQESEKKAIKAVVEVEKAKEKERAKIKAVEDEILWSARKSKSRYNKVLADFLRRRVKRIDWPKDCSYQVEANEQGVSIEIWTANRAKFARGIKTTGVLKYDTYAAFVLAVQTENLIDKLEGRLAEQKTGSGIILPKGAKWQKSLAKDN